MHVLGTPPAFVLSQDQTLMFNPLSLLIYGRTHPFSGPVLLKHDSLKILDCSCVLSLFCIVFKVRCSQASLYIIPRAHFSVNTFFEVFLLFLHLFLKPLSFNGFRFVRFALFFRLPPIFSLSSGHFVAFLLTLYAIFTQYPFFHAPPAPLPL